ncbi:hypothetical protein ABL78_7341 [Leptomonas seymouri]|uniref:Pyrroline-5-carboxylate reductase catalytic N-terminal domain-containing protein n=1 Tax=Leptomonas seymouri TaxID=5684 RepID=A0A0N0P3F8_LEPSE|nr:hypothetical protein ABL78_7341 [Leptomonas seymouri]|eukprot:KPI83627.1 hypothetical protein ABL78_7341 [Leptomonas seymouri]
MNSDCALLLQTVLGERGCVDPTLQDTSHTVPFAYGVMAEQCFYFIYAVSVVKALLHEKDAAFACLARWQTLRAGCASPPHPSAAPPAVDPCQGPEKARAAVGNDVQSIPADVPAITPCDSLDMFVTIIGGGTCCELLLRLLCESNNRNSAAHQLLVHPSHLSVVTRQPERLSRHAHRGVHCLKRHHGRAAVMQSDVVLLACPPALFQEVVNDLNTQPATAVAASGAESSAIKGAKGSAAVPSSEGAALPSSKSQRLLQPNAVLVSCMAGVPARKVALAFNRTPELTLTTRLPSHGGIVSDAGNTLAAATAIVGGGDTQTALVSLPALQQVALLHREALEHYKTRRMADLQCSISFLRSAVVEQQHLAKAALDAKNTGTICVAGGRAPDIEGRPVEGVQNIERTGLSPSTMLTNVVAPRLADFTAGCQPATLPSLEGFLDLWRLLQSYVRATFAEALRKAQLHGYGLRAGRNNSGLISVVLPENPHAPPRVQGEVEAELLPALALLPASKAMAVWEAWWRNGLRASRQDEDSASIAKTLSQKVTCVTGAWLGSVYPSDASLLADLELQYQRVLEAQLPRSY